MSNFKVGDKVQYDGLQVELLARDGDWWFIKYPSQVRGVVLESDLTTLAPPPPPKLGKVRVVVYPNGEAGAWSEQESAYAASARALTPGELKFDRAIDLDALDADKRRADAAERRAQQYAADLGAANKRATEAEHRVAELVESQRNRSRDYAVMTDAIRVALGIDNRHSIVSTIGAWRAELDRLRAAHADLVSLDELWEKHRLYVGRDLDSGWSVFNCNFMYAHGFQRTFPTHAAAWKAASEWAKQQQK